MWLNSPGKHFTLINVTYEQTEPKAKKGKTKPTFKPNEENS